MSLSLDGSTGPATNDLRKALEWELNAHGPPCRILAFDRKASPYRTSSWLEELEVGLESGAVLRILFKELGVQGQQGTVRDVKPAFVSNPRREIDVYRNVLAEAGLGTPFCYGAVADDRAGRYWLFLEHVVGRELYQVGDITVWQEVAAWLARFHARFAEASARPRPDEAACLLQYDEALYRCWYDRAVAFLSNDGRARTDAGRRALTWLSGIYDDVVRHLLAQPATFIHGEFYASNVLVQETETGLRVCPVDWEMAALGPGLIDLAALTTGGWNDDQRTAMAVAYHDALASAGVWRPSLGDLLTALDCCRLQAALQWLGWASEWLPPVEHRHDWLGDILRVSARLRF